MKTITTMTGKALVCMFLVAALAGCAGSIDISDTGDCDSFWPWKFLGDSTN